MILRTLTSGRTRLKRSEKYTSCFYLFMLLTKFFPKITSSLNNINKRHIVSFILHIITIDQKRRHTIYNIYLLEKEYFKLTITRYYPHLSVKFLLVLSDYGNMICNYFILKLLGTTINRRYY